MRRLASNADQPLGLTIAEADCLRAYIEHGSQKEAARQLGVERTTVEELVRRAKKRSGIKLLVHLLVQFDRAGRTV